MDNKALLAGGAFLVLAAGGALAVFTLLSRPSEETSRAVTAEGRGFDFQQGAQARKVPASLDSARSSSRFPAPGSAPRQAAPAPSSLGFVRTGADYAGGPGGGASEPSVSAAEAAARGDASGLLRGLAEDGGEAPPVAGSGKLSARAVRSLMQRVVETVKDQQPRWYKEFLADKSLKRVADRYHRTNDFKRFLKDLGNSRNFEAMLKRKYKTKGMRSLTRSIIKDPSLGPQLTQVFFEEAKNPDVVPLVSRYGAAAGLPKEMVEMAGMAARSLAGGRGSGRGARAKPQLKTSGFGSFEPRPGRPRSAEAAVEQNLPKDLPPGAEDMMKKYLKKK